MLKVDTAKVNGIEMKYATFGQGKKNFVIIPGLSFRPVTDNAQAVADAYAQFGDDYKVWLFDRRSNYPKPYSIKEIASDTVTVMKSLGIDKACIFGTSQGGMITQYIAADFPEIAEKIVLGSTACRLDDYSLPVVNKWHDLAKEGDTQKLAAECIDDMYSEATLNSFREILIEGNKNLTAQEIDNFITMTESILDFDCSAELKNVKCPALVIGCEGDRVLGGNASDKLADLLGAEKYIYGSEYSHCVYDEAPDYKYRILEFLSK